MRFENAARAVIRAATVPLVHPAGVAGGIGRHVASTSVAPTSVVGAVKMFSATPTLTTSNTVALAAGASSSRISALATKMNTATSIRRRSFASVVGGGKFANERVERHSNDAHAEALRRAGAVAPEHLPQLLAVLAALGHRPVAPSQRDGLHPLVLPLAKETLDEETGESGVIGLFLRPSLSPTTTSTLPIVRSGTGGVDLIAFDATQYIHRALVLEDAAAAAAADASGADSATMLLNNDRINQRPVADAAGALGRRLYTAGELAASPMPTRPEVFIQRNVGKFPGVMTGLALGHLEKKGDVLSALVTAEWYGNDTAFVGWGCAQAFNARMLARHDR